MRALLQAPFTTSPLARALVVAAAIAAFGPCVGCSGKKGRRRAARTQPAVVVVDPSEQHAPLPEVEPNDDRARAMLLTADATVKGSMAPGDADWYRVTLDGATPKVLAARLAVKGRLDLRLAAFDAEGKFLVKVDNTKAGEGERLVNLSLAPGTTYLRVALAKPKPSKRRKGRGVTKAKEAASEPVVQRGEYTLRYALRAPEAGEEREPNWKRSLASVVALGEEGVGYFGWRTDTDWYRVELGTEVAAGDHLRVELDGVDGVWSTLAVYDARGKLLQRRRGRPGELTVLAHLLRPAGDHFYAVVRCGRTFNVEARYSLRVSAAPPAGGSEVEPNDTAARASALPLEQLVTGLLPDVYDRDVFAVPVDRPGLLRVTLSPPLALDASLALLDGKGKVIQEVDAGGAGKAELIAGIFVQPPRALLRLRARKARAVDPVGSYRLFAKLSSAAAFEREPNGPKEPATPWPEGLSEVSGYLHPAKDIDNFSLRSEQNRGGPGALLEWRLRGPPGVKAELALVAKGSVIARAVASDGSTVAVQVPQSHSGRALTLRISALAGASGAKPYRLTRGTAGVSPAPGETPTTKKPEVAPIAPVAPPP